MSGFIRRWFSWPKMPPVVERDQSNQAIEIAASVGFLVLQIPAGVPPFSADQLARIERAVSDFGLSCAWPVRFVAVQAQIEEVG